MAQAVDVTSANAAQAEYWSSDSGQKWLRHQAILDAVFASVNNRLIELAAIQTGERVIDIGCGTGALTLDLERQVGDQGQVLALDISKPLLDRARQRLGEAGSTRSELVLADAQTYVFEPAQADLLISRFGVMFFDDPVAAFRNLNISLRPGGRLIFAAWAELAKNPWFDIPRDAAIAQFGQPSPRNPREPGPMAFADIDYVDAILRDAGWSDIQAADENILFDAAVSVDEITALVGEIGMAARMIREFDASEEDISAILARVRRAFAAFATDNGVRVPARLNIVQARKPA